MFVTRFYTNEDPEDTILCMGPFTTVHEASRKAGEALGRAVVQLPEDDDVDITYDVEPLASDVEAASAKLLQYWGEVTEHDES